MNHIPILRNYITLLRIGPPGQRQAQPPLPSGREARPSDEVWRSERLAAESGFGLIEVLISSLLVALIAIGTFTGFDVSNRATADQRARAQADAVAQQWEERMRGIQTSDIASLQKTFCVNDQGVEVASTAPCPASVVGYTGTIFTVETTGKFVSEASGNASCSQTSSSADFVQTTTKVTWPSIGNGQPVSETSVVTPPISSQLLVQDYNSITPIPNVTVAAVGPEPATTSKSLATGANGCALFTTLTPGNYAVNVNQSGYVEKDGNQSYTANTTLVAGSSSPVSLQYDRAGAIKAKFLNSATGAAVKGDLFLATNVAMTEPRGFGTANTMVTEVVSPLTLFPFASTESTPSYVVYAGGCTSNNPTSWGAASTVDRPANLSPGSTVAPTGALELPPVKMILTKNGSTALATGSGSITELTTGLPPAIVTPLTSPGSGPACGVKRTFTATTATGELPTTLQTLPFGKYELCVTANLGTSTANWYRYKTTFENKSAAGTTLPTINISTAEHNAPFTTKPTC
jgi:Tfp pilus assembly protein PilV